MLNIVRVEGRAVKSKAKKAAAMCQGLFLPP
jgi:hypothetical protein